MKLLGEMERVQEEICTLESQLERYQKKYPQLPDMADEQADEEVSQAGYWLRSKCSIYSRPTGKDKIVIVLN